MISLSFFGYLSSACFVTRYAGSFDIRSFTNFDLWALEKIQPLKKPGNTARLALFVTLPILTVDALIEVGFVSSTVGFLHNRAGRTFTIDWPNQSFVLNGKPTGILVNQGHISIGAAGTALVLVGVLGVVAMYWERRAVHQVSLSSARFPRHRRQGRSKEMTASCRTHHPAIPRSSSGSGWPALSLLSALLTFSALVYMYPCRNPPNRHPIHLSLHRKPKCRPTLPTRSSTGHPRTGSMLCWPCRWANKSDRSDIQMHFRLMRGWRWNLIPPAGAGGSSVWVLRWWMRREDEGI